MREEAAARSRPKGLRGGGNGSRLAVVVISQKLDTVHIPRNTVEWFYI